MRPPDPILLAQAIARDRPSLAVDILRAAGYTKRAAKRAVEASVAATFAKDTDT